MTLAAQCPACSRAFKIARDQLKLADGWVRCGACAHVFDGQLHLYEVPSPVPAQDSSSAAPVPRWAEPGEVAASSVDGAPAGILGLSDSAQPRHAWWLLANAVLLVALLFQWLWHNHADWLSRSPTLRNALNTLCAKGVCDWELPQNLSAISIEQVHFEPVSESAYRLSIQLKNASEADITTPWLEWSLTDNHDAVILRRYLSPEQLGLSRSLPALKDVETSITFQLNPQTGEQLSGYKTEIFYP